MTAGFAAISLDCGVSSVGLDASMSTLGRPTVLYRSVTPRREGAANIRGETVRGLGTDTTPKIRNALLQLAIMAVRIGLINKFFTVDHVT